MKAEERSALEARYYSYVSGMNWVNREILHLVIIAIEFLSNGRSVWFAIFHGSVVGRLIDFLWLTNMNVNFSGEILSFIP